MNKIIFWTMAAFAFLFASCAGEEEVTTPANPLKNKPINVDVLVSDIKTRAGYDNTSLPTKFYLTIDQGGTEHNYNNVVMKYEEGKWVAYESDAADAAKVEMQWSGSEGNITVKAATFSLAAASASLSAKTNQSTAEAIKSSDHLYYYSNAVTPSSDGTISIPFDHVMSKLEVKVTLRNQYGGSGSNPITSAIVFGSATSATYTIAEATPWSNKSDALDITPCLSAPYNSAERIANYEAILIPQNIATNTFGVKVMIGDKSYTWKSANPITLEGGKKYTLDLTLGKNELTLNKLSVGIWNEEKVTGLNAELVIPYVTFTAEKSQTCRFFISNAFATALGENEYFEYSVGDGEWKRFKTTVESIPFGGTLGSLRLRGKSSKGTAINSGIGYSRIIFTTENLPVDCTGDIRTLIDYENYANVSTANAKFCKLFYQNTQLRTAPSLPATTLADYCYQEMFYGCSALIEAPALPATTLAENCYCQMFYSCTALTKALELPATTLASYCYYEMFRGCSALTQAPVLPATTLASCCYEGMFGGCTQLTQAPSLPAKTLADNCYAVMFGGCTQLTQAPELPATTLANGCYQAMFSGCTSLTQAPELPAPTLAESCYYEMFRDCSVLSSVTMLATKISAHECLTNWLTNAGTNVSSRTLILANQEVYNEMCKKEYKAYNYLPDGWRVTF